MAVVKYLGYIKKLTNLQSEEMNVGTVAEMLKEIKNRYGNEAYKLAKKSQIIVNNESVAMFDGFRTNLKTDDIVQLLPVCGGG
jgi:molybdopterin converting factor small subunit